MTIRILLGIVAIILLAKASLAVWESVEARSWPSVAGTRGPGGSALYYYAVDGHSYVGNRVTSFDLAPLCPLCAVSRDGSGNDFSVRYKPGDPERSLISTDVPWVTTLFFGAVGLSLAILAILWRRFVAMFLAQIAPDKVFNGPGPTG